MRSPEISEDGIALRPSTAAKTLSDLKEQSKSIVGDVVAKAADGASSAKATTAEFASGLADTLREGAETQKNVGADAVATFARSARDAAENLEEGSPQVAQLVRTSADAVERVSAKVRDQSLSDLVDATGQFALRHPLAFLGCGVAAGFIVARLLSSSRH